MSRESSDMQAQQAATMRQPKRLPLVTQFSNRDNTFLKDARLVNAIAERYPNGEEFKVEKRPGLSITPAWNFGTSGTANSMFYWQSNLNINYLMFVYNSTLYLGNFVGGLHPGYSLSNLGAVSGTNTFWYLPIPAAQPLLVFGAGTQPGNGTPGSAYIYNSITSVLSTITDVNFPVSRVPGFAYLDGTTYVMDTTGLIWNSENEDDPTVWNALNFISAKGVGDIPVALAQQLTYIVAFKSSTTLFFYDAGNVVASPLAPIPGAQLNYGCLNADTIQAIDDILIWVTSTKTQSPQVALMENLESRIISTPQVDKLLTNLTVAGSINVATTLFSTTSFKFAGHRYYVLTNISFNFTLVFDIDQKLWYQWTDSSGNYYPVNTITAQIGGGLIAQLFTGNVYSLGADWTYPNDSGVVIPLDIYTPNFDAGIDREKYLSRMRFNADQQPQGLLLVRSSDDDYQTWSSWREVNMAESRPVLNDEGSFYRRAYNFRYVADTPMRLHSVDLQMDIGTL